MAAKWVKTSPYGDYTDPLQNHKYDGMMIFNKNSFSKDSSFNRIESTDMLIHQARYYYGKHIGSKKRYRLLNFVTKSNRVITSIKKKQTETKTEEHE